VVAGCFRNSRAHVHVLYKWPEIPANKAVPAIAVSVTYRKHEKAANPGSIPVSATKSFKIKHQTTHVPRQSTGTNIIAVAEAQRQTLLKNGQDQKVHGPRLDDCIERFGASRKEELGEKTAAAYRFQLDRLRAYCATRGVHFMRELSVDLLEDFKVEGLPDSMAATSKRR
jgi:hypothetical protein